MNSSFRSCVLAVVLLLAPKPALAHCDFVDGPVVRDAQAAIAAGDVTPALKWVSAAQEAGIRAAFAQTLAVRALGTEAQALADRFFFETLVRIHREGEGAPYTGLKPVGSPLDPGIAAADRALDAGSVDALVKQATHEVEAGLRERFARVTSTRAHAAHGVEHGRAWVAAYADFVHHAERVLKASGGGGEHAAPAPHNH